MNKKTLTIAGISALGLALIGSVAANAYSGPSGQNTSMTGRNFNQDRHAEMQKLLDTTDFQTWKDLMSKNPRSSQILSVINETNFPKFVEMQKMMMSGDKAGAEAIRAELGLPAQIVPQKGVMGRGHFDKGQNNAVQTAINNSDYNAWKIAIENTPMGGKMLEVINESNFSQLLEMHKLMQAGDKAGAEAIEQKLGLEKPFGMEHRQMMKGNKNIKSTQTQS
ncbi:MAG: hypothetical protein COU28_03140 [Candidatus Magasanikbacteria bacterium CG10_big_fil_rev_8_21_14_0_10_36_16]|uniref:DUF305 domain-containing protein n=1 Tax=Candidatus Magasanikbacteria bacterium CG10_big_fil_rev_8_21_14_0_10_36_16 TaxID=1974645 RepID=A0A2H0TY52_9BACT|nr:MAG: hypothetical protein COU28_03140 [Candidatus Magasanikbacteria bacterium CG10_big_fil_rev_8_21_14_0_10_36_16]